MKKTYVKPEIMFEDFSLSTNIAAGCEYTSVNSSQSSSCGLIVEDSAGLNFVVFTIGNAGCSTTQVPETGNEAGYNGICYHVPSDSSNVFNS